MTGKLPDDVAVKLATALIENVLWLRSLKISYDDIERLLNTAVKFNIMACKAMNPYEKENH